MLHGRSAFGLKIPTIGLGQAAVKESAVWQSSGGDEWLTDDCIVSPSFDGLNKCAKFTWQEKRWRSGSKISTNTPDLTVSMWLCEMWHSISLKCKLDVLKCVVINREIHFKFWLMPIFHLSRCCGYCCFLAERLNTFNEVYLHNDYWGFFRPIVYISFTAELNSGMLQTAGASGLLFPTRLAQGPHLSGSLHQNYYVSWYHQGSLRCLRWRLPLFSHFLSHHYS